MIDSKPLKLISAHTGAVTFTFAGRSLGWANCTVNDHTGELHIMSDWGSWAYRWDPSSRSLGATDLTSFIASRDMPDYIANKLQREGRDASCLDVDETVRGMRRELCRQRRIDGRRSSIGGAGVGVDRMSKREARAIWDALGEAMDNHGDDGTHAGEALFWSEVMNIDGIHHVDDQPWEYAVHKQTPEDRVLRGYIVPALIKACKRLVDVRESGAQPVTHSVLIKGDEAPDHG